MDNTQPRIRTIPQCLQEIKLADSNSSITENFIRLLCKSNKVQHFKSGNRYLINLDSLLKYLSFKSEMEI